MKVVVALAIALLLDLPILSTQLNGNNFARATNNHVRHRAAVASTASKHRKFAINSSHGHSIVHSGRRTNIHSQVASSRARHKHSPPKTRYAYPMSLFLYEPPSFDSSPLSEEQSLKLRKAFMQGTASEYPTRSLVKARLVISYPIRGGIFFRREPIKNIIIHSTEPGISVGAKVVIDGWSHGGRRHPGAHYVVERDGIIYQALDPDLAAVHVNIFKTLPGFDNDNSVGIEMCHQGSQNYPPEQVQSVIRLVVYLQNHYHVADSNIVTHRYAQQGDHTDPVNFGWSDFIADKTSLQTQSLNCRLADLKTEALAWQPIQDPVLGQNKTYRGRKSVVIDLTKTNTPVVAPGKAGIGQAASIKSASETMSRSSAAEAQESLTPPLSTSIPSSAGANLVPVNSGTESRLVPMSPMSRLVPVSNTAHSATVIINNKPETNTYQQLDAAAAPIVPVNSKSTKILPLRGPIEMDPNEAADLLAQ